VYLHHWLVFNQNRPNLGVCPGFLTYNFGIGAESRGTPLEYPSGHGWVAHSDDPWGINLHILRTVGLEVDTIYSQAVKECIECWPGKGKSCKTAGFDCCQDGSFCPTDGSVSDAKKYYFQYSLEYTTNLAAIVPVHGIVLDASNCQIETNIEGNDVNPWSETTHSWKSPISGNIVFSVGHLHNAGKNIKLSINNQVICTTEPVYGTEEGKAGNEKGYLVANPGCENAAKVEAGDKITVRSQYWVRTGEDPTGSGLPGGFHGGVMSYFYLAIDQGSLRDATGDAVTHPEAIVFETFEDSIV